MANYKKIMELRPEVTDFVRTRGAMRYRGEILAYGRNIRCSSYSTDAGGFRHSTFRGKTLSVRECLRSERYGIVLGPSTTFGFCLGGNENTMPSLLAERFGFPFANVSMPTASTRNLHALLLAMLERAPRPPAVLVMSNGGDLGGFCTSSVADQVFGSPNRGQLSLAKRRRVPQSPERSLPKLLAFTNLWSSAIANLCRGRGVPIAMLHQSTAFEKTKLTSIEQECELGVPRRSEHERLFANHRKFDAAFFEQRKAIAERVGAPLAGWGLSDQLGFVDEFHCDRDATRLLSNAVGDAIEALLAATPTEVDAGALTDA
jgi:hypothetical protein